MTPLQLEGRVDTRDQEIVEYQQRIAELEEELTEARQQRDEAKRQAIRAVAGVRRVMDPLYSALRTLYGEMAAIPEDVPTQAAPASPSPVWDAWKNRLGLNCSRIIDALLTHGELNTTQLSIATGISRNNIPTSIFKLNKASLINKNGGRFSLKQL